MQLPCEKDDTEDIKSQIAQFHAVVAKNVTNYNDRLSGGFTVYSIGNILYIGFFKINANSALPLDITIGTYKFSILGTISHSDVLALFHNDPNVNTYALGSPLVISNNVATFEGTTFRVSASYFYRANATTWYFLNNTAIGASTASTKNMPETIVPANMGTPTNFGNNP